MKLKLEVEIEIDVDKIVSGGGFDKSVKKDVVKITRVDLTTDDPEFKDYIESSDSREKILNGISNAILGKA